MISRRNTLVGIGSLVVGGGAVLATGAFSTVEAQRDVTIETAGDEAALLGLEINDDVNFSGVSDGGGEGEALQLDFDNINLTATTVFNDLVTVTNGGENEIELHVEGGDGGGVFSTGEDGGVDLWFESDSAADDSEDPIQDGNTVTIGSGDSEDLTVVLDTEGVSEATEEVLDIEVTFVANATE